MLAGDYAHAWSLSDAVLAVRDPLSRDDPRLPYHLRWVWDGRRFDGRHVLVRCYHGLGDTLQFARYLAPLRARAASVTVEAPAPLAALMCSVPGVDEVIPFDPANPAPPRDLDLEIMELGHALRLAPDDPAVSGILLNVGQAMLQASGRIGLCWRAGDWNNSRSVPLQRLLATIRERPLVSLQRGSAAVDATAPAFVNPRDSDTDMIRTARLVASCALVVTVDSFVAHLAGTLRIPSIVLLKHNADWRWGLGDWTCWYPSHRLVRQTVPGQWSVPLAQLSRLLGY